MSFNGWDLLKLINALRAVNIPVSSQEIEEVLKILHQYPEIEAKIVLKSILIHREEDIILFDLIWQMLFSNKLSNPKEEEIDGDGNSNVTNNTCENSSPSEDSASGYGQGIGHGGITLEVKNMAKFGNQIDLALLPKILNEPPPIEFSNIDEYTKYALGQIGYLAWINSIELKYKRDKISDEEYSDSLKFGETLTKFVKDQLLKTKLTLDNSWEPLREEHWQYKSFNRFLKNEENEVHKALRHMSRKLAVRPGWRKIKANSGTISLSSALKETVRGNGTIFRLQYEKRALKRPELVVLCDVSNSVAPFSEFLLYLIKNIQKNFRRVRVFLYIDCLWDISHEQWTETEEMTERIRSWGRKSTSGYSDYGEVFKEFAQGPLQEISSKATVLILGDAKNNYRPAQEEYLKMIWEKVKRVIWLNPLDESQWQDRDNILRYYQPYCSQIVRCKNIDDLRKITRMII